MFICRQKNQLHPSCFLEILNILQTYYIGYFEYAWLRTPKVILSTCVYLQAKKSTSSFMFPWDIGKILQIYYFGYFGHVWACLATPKKILSTCTKTLCLSAGKKTTSSPMFFLKILQGYANFLFWIPWQAWLCTPKMIVSPRRKL